MTSMMEMNEGLTRSSEVRWWNILIFDGRAIFKDKGRLRQIGMDRLRVFVRRVQLDIEGPSSRRKIGGGQKGRRH